MQVAYVTIEPMVDEEKLDPKSGFYRGFGFAVETVALTLECMAVDDADARPMRAEFLKNLANKLRKDLANKNIVKRFRLKSPRYRRSMFRLINGGKE